MFLNVIVFPLGTWEHKARQLEMEKTQSEAERSNQLLSGGTSHIGDFLPPEEFDKFMNKYKVERRSLLQTEFFCFCFYYYIHQHLKFPLSAGPPVRRTGRHERLPRE